MSDTETPRRTVREVTRRNILDALTGETPVLSIAAQKTAKKQKEEQCKMEKNLEVLYERRDMLLDKLLRMNESIRKENVSTHLLRLHLETLRRTADEYDKNYADISALLSKDDRVDLRKEYVTFEELHNQLYVCLQMKIGSIATEANQNQVAVQPPVYVPQAPQLHAPFPTFDGNPENWYSFKNLFTSLMSRYPNETPAMKILHLRNSLIGEAKEKIDQQVVNNNDYNMAWKILTDAYEDRRLIMDTHIDALLDIPKVSKDNRGKSISNMVEISVKHTDALKSHGYPVDGLSELILVNVLYKKLDGDTQEQWESKLGSGQMPDFTVFMDFLKEKGRVLQRTTRFQQQAFQQSSAPGKLRQPAMQKQSAPFASKSFIQTMKETCPCCKEEHSIYKCTKFQELNTEERKSIAMKSMLCYNCLKSKHRVADCPSDQGCKIQGCGRRHHSMLHPTGAQRDLVELQQSQIAKPTEQPASPETSECESSATTLCGSIGGTKRQVLLSTAEVLVIGQNGVRVKSRALLDSGSDSNIVTEKLAAKLNLQLQPVDLPISGLNDIQTRVKYIVSTNIISRVNQFSTSILDFLVVPKVTSNLPVTDVDHRSWPLPPGLQLADPSFHVPGEIDLIIGNEIFFDLIKQGRLKLDNAATLTETELGWVVGGSVQTRKSRTSARVCQLSHQEEMLSKTLQQFWEIENVGAESKMSVAEALVEEHFVTTHTRNGDGRYTVRFPFNEFQHTLGDSYETASKRLDKLLIALTKDPLKREQYFSFMSEYRSLGHMEEVSEDDRSGYYIPHHAVYKATSSTTKIRVVFDASARTTTGVALNDIVCVGPTVQSDLQSIILRFCSHPIVLTADIPKMYRQILLHKDDRNFQKILWVNDSGVRTVYKLSTVTYGVASSPHHATRTLIQLATDEGKTFPLAEQVIRHDSYVDDFLTGGKTVNEVVSIYKELSTLLQLGGFGVHKFCSNDPAVLSEIPEELQETCVSFEDTGINNTIRTLGLIWNPLEDYFTFCVQTINEEISTTKRKVLSDIGRLFDPLGFLGPIITAAKLVMQDIWRVGLNWDDELPEEIQQKWIQFRRQLPVVNEMRKPRCVIPGDAIRIELHGYSDASKRAYGAVVYARCIAADGSISVKLVASKSRVAPIKPVTIPRLELCGAKLLAELVEKITSTMNIKFDDVTLWCDSSIVLCWLKKSPSALNQFVSNRVAAVVEMTSGYRWQYVQSANNPADVISRGASPEELLSNELWWNGAPNLQQASPRPDESETIEEIPEMKTATVLTTVEKPASISLDRVSNYRKLQRAWAYVLRFIDLTKHKRRDVTSIKAVEMTNAERAIFLVIQQEAFGDLKKNLQSGSSKRHSYSNLAPFIGLDGLIRVGGRLKYSAIPYDGKHQVLLPERHYVTEALIRRLHEEHHHVGQGGLLAIVRERYWPLRAKSAIKRILSGCQICAKHRPTFGKQIMGDLPEHRVTPAPVFSKVGVDYAGPFLLKPEVRSTKSFKAYVIVFVCMAVKAIHFELVSNLTSENFIAALHRFSSRRGIPSDIFSDNGTSFVGANHELAALNSLFNDQLHQGKLGEFCATRGITWHFIPPRSPHFGGIWEAGVKSLKYHMKRIIGETRLTTEEMNTFLAQTEAILNSRPLSAMSEDPSDMGILTPSHFLIGRSAVAIPEPSYATEKVSRLSRWQHIQFMQQHFWNRWSKEYLHHLQTRQKWHGEVKRFDIGALVLLVDENVPPQQWRRGRIVATHPGNDEAVRVVTVRTATGEFKRAVTKIALLPSVEPSASTGGV